MHRARDLRSIVNGRRVHRGRNARRCHGIGRRYRVADPGISNSKCAELHNHCARREVQSVHLYTNQSCFWQTCFKLIVASIFIGRAYFIRHTSLNTRPGSVLRTLTPQYGEGRGSFHPYRRIFTTRRIKILLALRCTRISGFRPFGKCLPSGVSKRFLCMARCAEDVKSSKPCFLILKKIIINSIDNNTRYHTGLP